MFIKTFPFWHQLDFYQIYAFLKNNIEKRKPLCKTTNWDEHFDTSNIKIGLEITEEFC